MTQKLVHILLADDDKDDCLLFSEALGELYPHDEIQLSILHNGEELMQLLNQPELKLPDVLFLDLNMPLKNGFACLKEIRSKEHLQQLPVLIFTTAHDPDSIGLVYRDAAHYFIRKPNDFTALKNVVQLSLSLIAKNHFSLPQIDSFVLNDQI